MFGVEGRLAVTWVLQLALAAPVATSPARPSCEVEAPKRASLAGRAWCEAVARLAGFVLLAELLRRSLFTEGAVQALLAEQPWQAWAVGHCVLAALFAQNYGGCEAMACGARCPQDFPAQKPLTS